MFDLTVNLLSSLSSPVTLMSHATNLLHARDDTEAQRLWIVIAHQLVELFVKKTDVCDAVFIQNTLTNIVYSPTSSRRFN